LHRREAKAISGTATSPRHSAYPFSSVQEERKTIGALFIDVFEAEAKKIGGAQFLA
jgi:GMP synthase PP-ATPase subunit